MGNPPSLVCAVLIGREGSVGFPGKNVTPVLDRPLVEYPLQAAQDARQIDQIYMSTDSEKLKTIARNAGATIIDRPAHLATTAALGEDVFVHAHDVIRDRLSRSNQAIELLVLLMANAATITPELIDEGVRVLREHPDYDSAVSVSRYNMWSPLRARKIGSDGLLHPFVPFETFGDPKTLNCDRDSQGDVWFADMGVSIIRPACLTRIAEGLLPQRWMGQNIYPLKQWGGLDVDYPWQLPQVEFWLREHGWPKKNPTKTTRAKKTRRP